MNKRDRIAIWEVNENVIPRIVPLDIQFDKEEIDEIIEKLDITRINKNIYNIYIMILENAKDFIMSIKISQDVNYIASKKINCDDILMRVNKAIFNYCSSFGMYIDVIEKNLSKISKDKVKSFQTKCKELYDNQLEYRFFAKLRNYIVHYDMPFDSHEINFENSRVICHKQHLLKFKGWKTVKYDIEKMDDEIDIVGMLKEMNKNLAIILLEFQALISDNIVNAYETVVKFMKKYNLTNEFSVIRDYSTEKKSRDENLTITCINLRELLQLMEELKHNPLVKIKEK